MKRLIIPALAFLVMTSTGARNLSAEASLDHDLWWEASETPNVKITLTDTTGVVNNSKVTFIVTDDRDASKQILNVTQNVFIPTGGNTELMFDIQVPEPGFYKCYVKDDGNIIKQFNIGFEPKQVTSLPSAKSDFDEFWAKAKADLAAVPGEYQITEDKEKSGKKRKAYAVSMKSLGGETIRGYLYMPIAKGKYPAKIYYNGYNSGVWPFDVDGNPDWVEFVSSIRGQMYNKDYNTYGDWIQYRLDDPEEYYYRGAFMDAVRVIDFVSQLDKVNPELIFAEGGSQGGALTLAAASLDDRLCAIAPYIPFLTDYPDYFRIVDWPASAIREAQKTYGLTDEQVQDNLTY
ncbi:MAG: acetylxylan esterase, partial [Muribaculaceae bacterium]|nr:acetylxylan esterase [Muribaculaceae bacterium]